MSHEVGRRLSSPVSFYWDVNPLQAHENMILLGEQRSWLSQNLEGKDVNSVFRVEFYEDTKEANVLSYELDEAGNIVRHLFSDGFRAVHAAPLLFTFDKFPPEEIR